jgi:flagellar motor switch protein FliM
MTDNSSLSGEEVSALMDQLGAHEAGTVDTAPKPYAFGSEAMRPMSALPALDRMSERMARRLREAIEPLARMKPRIESEPVEVQRFESWRAAQPEFTSLSLYRFRPLKGGMLLAIEPELVGRLVDTFYGGSGAPSPARGREFTPTEERLLGRLADAVVATLTEIWSEVVPVQPSFSGRETNIAYATLVHPGEPVAVARFAIGLGAGRPGFIQILYPVSSLRAIEHELVARIQDDGGSAGSDWRSRLASALGEVRVEARSVLARPNISVSEMLNLAPGDLIPISLPALVPLLVNGRIIAQGTIGEHDGRAALKIEKFEDRSSR